MKKIIVFCIMILFVVQSHAQWRATSGPSIGSNNLGMSFSHLVVKGDVLYAILNNLVYISYNKGKSWMYASGIEPINAFRMTCSGSNIYVGTSGSGVFVSKNFGSTYQAINNLPQNAMVSAIFATENVLMVALYTDYPNQVRGVYLSVDKGATWTTSGDLSEKFIKCFTNDGTNLYAGANEGVFMSSDNGKSWKNIGLQNAGGIYSIAVKNNKIYAAEASSNGNIYFTSDNGLNWKTISGGLPTNTFFSLAVIDNHLYVASGWDGAFRSSNDGASWTKIINGGGDQIVYLIEPDGHNLYAGFHSGFASSTDNGATWEKDLNTFNSDIRSIAIVGSKLMATTNEGLTTSKDEGLTWEREYIDMKVFETVDAMLYIGGENGFSRSFDLGENQNWQNIRGLPVRMGFTDMAASGSMVFASLYNHGIYFSDDYASNWIPLNNGITDYQLLGLTLIDSTIYAASENKGVFRSFDLGRNWSPASNGLLDMHVTCLSHYKNNLYAGTNSMGIFKSVDNGNNWVQLQNEFSNSKVLSLYTYGVNIFAGVEGKGFYMSANNGIDWAPHNTGLVNYNVNSMTENDKDLYLGSKGGAIWKRALSELPLTLSIKNISASDRIVCKGSTTVLTGFVVGGQPPFTYQWSNGSKSSSIIVTPSETTTYTLTVLDANSQTATYDLKIWVNNIPDAPVITMSGDTLISNYTSGNIWMSDGKTIEYETSQKFIPWIKKGNYSVKVIKNGCMSKVSNVIALDVHKLANGEAIKIFPNPAHNILHIEMKEETGKTVFSLLNMQGQISFRQEVEKKTTTVEIGKLPRGVYVARLENDNYIIVEKIVLE